MTYVDAWKALMARIQGIMRAAELDARYLAIKSEDTFGSAKQLRAHGKRILDALDSFRAQYASSLPSAAAGAIDAFLASTRGYLADDGQATTQMQREATQTALVRLAAFEAEISYLLADSQEIIRARSERAFAHLQRSIVADLTFRATWQRAFDESEIACEKLGAAHLLLHGIWAFKVDAAGERTDLVFQEPAGDLAAEQRYADGFVLTEWKKSTSAPDATKKFAQALRQMQLYAQGGLGGSELAACRYAIVVSSAAVIVPVDVTESGVLYRHVNIAVNPQTPSRRNKL